MTGSSQTAGSEATKHKLVSGDARDLSFIDDESVHLIVTSPPYWSLKRYEDHPSQMGHMKDYEVFLAELEKVWGHAYRVLVPGGRLVCVVGDVCEDTALYRAANRKVPKRKKEI